MICHVNQCRACQHADGRTTVLVIHRFVQSHKRERKKQVALRQYPPTSTNETSTSPTTTTNKTSTTANKSAHENERRRREDSTPPAKTSPAIWVRCRLSWLMHALSQPVVYYSKYRTDRLLSVCAYSSSG